MEGRVGDCVYEGYGRGTGGYGQGVGKGEGRTGVMEVRVGEMVGG